MASPEYSGIVGLRVDLWVPFGVYQQIYEEPDWVWYENRRGLVVYGIRCARSVGEFALQFLIYGLTEGANGRFVTSKTEPAELELTRLPITPWPEFLFAGEMEFVGARGLIGLRSAEGVSLCATEERFSELTASPS